VQRSLQENRAAASILIMPLYSHMMLEIKCAARVGWMMQNLSAECEFESQTLGLL